MFNSKYPNLVNRMQTLIDNFLTGALYSKELSGKVFATFDTVKGEEYPQVMARVKKMMTDNKARLISKNVFHIPLLQVDRDEIERNPLAVKVAVIRYVNICRKGNFIIVLGNEILYVPEHHRHLKDDDLQLYVNITLREEETRTSSKLANHVRSWIFGARFNMLKTVVQL